MAGKLDRDRRDFAWDLGDRLREARHAKRLTQTEVASACGVEQGRYAKWERGHMPPPSYYIPSLCRELGLSPQAVLGMEEP